jgi:AhpD family alkylhydroperoxidase
LCGVAVASRLINCKQVQKIKERLGVRTRLVEGACVGPLRLLPVITMKNTMSRFQIHDDLTAPEGSMPVLRGALATGGQLPNFLGVLAGSPAALRAYARFRSELRHGKLTLATLERIALGVAEYYQSEPGIAMHSRTARAAGLAIDEVALAGQWSSKDEREAALLRYLKALLEERGRAPMHLHEEAREAGWDDEQILEAIAAVALEAFTAMVNVAGDVPVDGSSEASRALKAA